MVFLGTLDSQSRPKFKAMSHSRLGVSFTELADVYLFLLPFRLIDELHPILIHTSLL